MNGISSTTCLRTYLPTYASPPGSLSSIAITTRFFGGGVGLDACAGLRLSGRQLSHFIHPPRPKLCTLERPPCASKLARMCTRSAPVGVGGMAVCHWSGRRRGGGTARGSHHFFSVGFVYFFCVCSLSSVLPRGSRQL